MQNSVQEANVKKTKHNIFKTVCKKLTYRKIVQNTLKTVREALAYQTIIQNTFKTVRNTLTWLQILQKQIKKRAQATNVPNSQTENIQDTAQNTKV